MNERLRVLFCDHLSLMRGKFLPTSKIADGSTRFCQSTFGVHFDKDLLPSPGSNMLNGLPDIVLNWQESEIRDSWLDNTKVVIGDLADSDGNVFSACARSSLKRAVSDWQKQGLNPKIGIELEAYAFVKEDNSWVPYSAPGDYVYATGPFGDDIGFNDEIWWKAEELGFKLEMITSEYDSSQFEYTLKFNDAVKAVDDLVLFKLMAREIALQKGVLLSFLPKPILESGGSGMHINMSFFDSEGQNQMSASEHGGIENMTELSKQCVSGLVHHHEALAAILAPTANSYQRLQTASLSGFWKNWGGDHRNVTTRVSGEGGLRARIEHRMADASANPYSAVTAVLQAARLGTLNNYDLPPVETGDGFESNDAKLSVASSLKDAVDSLQRDDILSKAVGSEMIRNHVFMKQQEVLKTDGLSPEEIIRFYLPYI